MMQTINWKSGAFRRILCFVSFSALPTLIHAQAWQLEPSVSLGQAFDNNFRVSSENKDKVYTTRLAGALKLSRLTETFDVEGLARIDFIKYLGDDEDLSDRHNQLGGFKASRKWERTRIGLDFLFRRDSLLRSVRVREEVDNVNIEPDQSIDDNLTRRNVRRNRFNVRPSMSYQLTERTTIGLRYEYRNTFYGNDQGANVDDFDLHTGYGSLDARVTERNRVVARLSGGHFDSDSGRQTDNVALQVGWGYDWSETTKLTLTGGVRHTEFDEGDSDQGFVGRLQARRLLGNTRFDARLERNITPSGSGRVVETDSLDLNALRRITPFLSFSIRSRIFENENIGSGTSGSNRRRLDVIPALNWTVARNWSLETSYRYIRQKRVDEPDTANAHSVFINITYRAPKPLEW